MRREDVYRLFLLYQFISTFCFFKLGKKKVTNPNNGI